MITPSLPSNFANAISPFSPVGKQAVGEENIEARNTPFKPVEELSESNRLENRASTAERAAEADERVNFDPRGQSSDDQSSADQSSKEQSKDGTAQPSAKPLQSDVDSAQQQADQKLIDELSQRDREVKLHEAAHMAAGGALTGAANYRYQRGPDGASYAIGGEVSISTGVISGDPEATLQNARRVARAALAPAEPSPQDRRVAAEAAQIEQQALQQIAAQASEQRAQVDEEIKTAREERARDYQEQASKSEEQARKQADIDQQNEARRIEAAGRAVDLNRRLIEIGALETPAPVGGLLNLNA